MGWFFSSFQRKLVSVLSYTTVLLDGAWLKNKQQKQQTNLVQDGFWHFCNSEMVLILKHNLWQTSNLQYGLITLGIL